MAYLKILSGPAEGQQVELEKDETTIGRSDENTLTLDDASVSSHHCSIIRDGNRYSVRDLGSTNGTTLNRRSVSLARLKAGDIVAVGETEMEIGGDDIEVEGEATTKTQRAPAKGGSATTRRPSMEGPPPFGAKRDTRLVWILSILFVVLLVGAALAWFLVRLFA